MPLTSITGTTPMNISSNKPASTNAVACTRRWRRPSPTRQSRRRTTTRLDFPDRSRSRAVITARSTLDTPAVRSAKPEGVPREVTGWHSAAMPDVRLTAKQFQEAGGTEDWRVLAVGASSWFDAPSHAAGAELLRGIVALVDDGAPQPDVDLRPSGVHVRIPSGPTGLSAADVSFARAISDIARGLELRADPAALQSVQLAIDAVDTKAVMPFWRIVFGYEESEDGLTDSLRRDPGIWFQQADQLRPLRNRIHVDVAWADDIDNTRRAEVLANGGHVVNDERPWVIDDPEGNEACLPLGPTAALGDDPETQDWRQMGSAITCYPTGSFRESVDLATAVARLADDAGKGLMVDVRPGCITLDSGKDQHETENFGLDEGFMELARRAQAAARGMGRPADPSPRRRFLQISIHAVDVPAVRPFWMAVLGYQQGPYQRLLQDIYDPRRINPVFWFQQIDAKDVHDEARRAQRNRIHVDLFVPDDQAQARIDAALAAGGRIANDSEAPAWWTLADPEGNEVDVAVASGREEAPRPTSHAPA
ncbi:VOC family protein [Actinopolymorpha sp. B17G11]|uniref:VOC family protein n=1 Tax=Actinopolymorpha sp. B17G11 TaxID=3160861 RepID=UPI0032E4E8A6